MTDHMVLWESPNGANLPANADTIQEISILINALDKREVSKITKAFENDLYDMATEYTWRRTVKILNDKVLDFGAEFVLEMLGRNPEEANQSDFLSEIDTINLAADLGFISKTGKMQLSHASELINHYASKDSDSEMSKIESLNSISQCIKYVLNYSDENYQFSFNNFRDILKKELIDEDNELFAELLAAPYFYKRTTVRTLLNLAKNSLSAEREKVLANMAFIIPRIWDDLYSDDRWPIGFAYSESVNDGNEFLMKSLRSILLKVKGFDYVPENLRSLTFLDVANKLLKTHFEIDNFYGEEPVARLLSSLGTSIPSPALGKCLTATIACKLGNHFGHSFNAENYLDKILDGIIDSRWEYYLSKVLPADETILYKLQDFNILPRWFNLTGKYKFGQLSIDHPQMQKLIDKSLSNNKRETRNMAIHLLDKIR